MEWKQLFFEHTFLLIFLNYSFICEIDILINFEITLLISFAQFTKFYIYVCLNFCSLSTCMKAKFSLGLTLQTLSISLTHFIFLQQKALLSPIFRFWHITKLVIHSSPTLGGQICLKKNLLDDFLIDLEAFTGSFLWKGGWQSDPGQFEGRPKLQKLQSNPCWRTRQEHHRIAVAIFRTVFAGLYLQLQFQSAHTGSICEPLPFWPLFKSSI